MADTSDVIIAVIPEVTPGTTPATPGFKNLRLTSETLTPTFETLVSSEIRSDATVSDVRRSGLTVSGDMGFELHRDTNGFDLLLAAAVRGTWTANVAKGGTLKPSFTFERKINGTTASYLRFAGSRITGMSLNLTPDELITGTMRVTGTAHTTASSIITGATYAAASNNPPMAGIDVSSLAVSGVAGVDYTNLTMDIDLSTRIQRKLGQVAARGVGFGRRVITGQLTCFFEDLTAYTAFINDTTPSIIATCTDGTNSYTITLPRVRFTSGEVPVPGNDADFILTLGYQATYDTTLGTDIQISRTP